MARAIDDGCRFGVRHFLLGSTAGVLRRLEENLAQRFPEAKIVGRLSLPFFESDGFSGAEETLADVRRASPHVVWLSLGCPKQELWMLRYAQELAPALVAGVGAAFDFHSGSKPRAPDWVQRAGSLCDGGISGRSRSARASSATMRGRMVGMSNPERARTPELPLRCDECGGPYRGERGWRAYRTREPEGVAVFCPACAAREFDELSGADTRTR